MQRRRLLAAVGATSAALAGCAAGSDSPSSTETPEPCTAARPDPVDPDGEMEPYEYPERPDEWTAENVELFLQTFESTYRQHEILTAETTAYGHSASVEKLQERNDGYRVELKAAVEYGTEASEPPRDALLRPNASRSTSTRIESRVHRVVRLPMAE